MKLRYKKTGKIVDFEIKQKDKMFPFQENTICFINDNPISLKVLNEYYEDVKEPLIKDEKIRKAVRAWAEAEDEDCYYGKDAKTIYNGSGDKIEFWSEPFCDLEKDRHYTIEELCGSEE